ncbi:DUF6528 family protein [Streptomyces sp. Ac-502]|uniref:DUF6528 family protein n=1 Tax=Streptomyces sp. Ac-502 TaxID=3342801 RepID=UPI0038629740
MNRRTLLKAAAAVAGAPLASWAVPARAHAAGAYHVAVCEQARNVVLVHPADVEWTPASQVWRWSPPAAWVDGKNAWLGLSDVRFRNAGARGWVALVTASAGKVGIVGTGKGGALLWSARPYGNPHAIERVPATGAVVTASSQASDRVDYPGFLTVYGPRDPEDPSTLTRVQEIKYQGAHGLYFDGGYLWALGTWTIAKYRVTGNRLDTRLEQVWKYTFEKAFNGHGLDADYSDHQYLLVTSGGSVRRLHKASGQLTDAKPTGVGVKSFCRVVSGESFWQQAISVTDPASHPDAGTGYWNTYVQFFDAAGSPSFRRALKGYGYDARFYTARATGAAFS